jgi:hypothetical protein
VPKLIVTLTSYPARIKTVHIVIEALFRQKLKPDMIVLYLGYDKFPNKDQDLPKELVEQITRGLSIHWVKDIGCFTGLIPALIEFPDDIIINIDDDVNYDDDFLTELYEQYKKNPNTIHTHGAHRILFDYRDILLPYHDWGSVADFYDRCVCFYIIDFLVKIKRFLKVKIQPNTVKIPVPEQLKRDKASFQNFIISTLGTLYPPHCLHEDVKNVELAYKLTPTNDDIWFWTQAIRNKTKIQITKKGYYKFDYIEGTQETALFNSNLAFKNKLNKVRLTPNDHQLEKVFDYYPELMDNIRTERLSYSIRKRITLFKFIPLLNIFHYNKYIIIVALFDIFPLLIIKKNYMNSHPKVYLLGIIPLFEIR